MSIYAKNIIITLTTIFQFVLYCIPAAEITVEGQKIADSVFYNNWYESNGNIQTDVQFVIMKTQGKLAFSAGGVADISRETITFVRSFYYAKIC